MSHTSNNLLPAGIAIALALLPGFASAQEARPDPNAIVQDEPAFFVRGDVNKASRAYQEGDALSVSVLSEVEAYVYVLYQQADGKVFQIFPNSHQKENKIPAKTRVVVPAADDSFRWEIGAPFGKESVKVIASKTPIKPLDDPALKQGRFNAVNARQIGGVGELLNKAEAAEWAEDVVEITTVSKSDQRPAQAPRRVGVFFGNSTYRFAEVAKEASGGKWNPNLPNSGNGAKILSKVLRDFGRLDDMRVYTGEQSTKKQMEEAITKWLPSVTKPGDTIIIFNGGHGGPIPDDNGDEADGKDEFIMTYDWCSLPVAAQMLKQKEEGRLAPEFHPLLAHYQALVKGARSVEEMDARIIRETCVTDDLLGHWLQRLAGRQVLVIFDVCHAFGFAAQEKSLVPPTAADAAGLDFLDGEIARLKDLGQRDQALIAACGKDESSWSLRRKDKVILNAQKGGRFEEWVTDDLAILTYFVARSVVESSKPLTLEECHAYCAAGMKEHFKITKLEPHTPHFFNYSTKPLFLKP